MDFLSFSSEDLIPWRPWRSPQEILISLPGWHFQCRKSGTTVNLHLWRLHPRWRSGWGVKMQLKSLKVEMLCLSSIRCWKWWFLVQFLIDVNSYVVPSSNGCSQCMYLEMISELYSKSILDYLGYVPRICLNFRREKRWDIFWTQSTLRQNWCTDLGSFHFSNT